ncbi:hypothetical protein P9112_014224 [Eukaryota sp. TZLM1-RC]
MSGSHPDSFICDIHGSLLHDPVLFPGCGHTFCNDCITKWVHINPTCPSCRTKLKDQKLTPNLRLTDVMSEVLRPRTIRTSDLSDLSVLSRTPRAVIESGTFNGRPIVFKQPYFTKDNEEKLYQSVTRVYQAFQAMDCPSSVVGILGITTSPPGVIQEKLDLSLQMCFDQKRRVSTREALIIAEDIAMALLSFHSVGFVHRDVSAGNVFLKIRGNQVIGAKLGDFDEVRSTEVTLTQPGLGTVAYVAPEVMSGKNMKANVASDVFSFGVLLWALFTNTDPSRVVDNVHQFNYKRVEKEGAALIDLELLKKPLKSMITSMVSLNETSRPLIREIAEQIQGIHREFNPISEGELISKVQKMQEDIVQQQSLIKDLREQNAILESKLSRHSNENVTSTTPGSTSPSPITSGGEEEESTCDKSFVNSNDDSLKRPRVGLKPEEGSQLGDNEVKNCTDDLMVDNRFSQSCPYVKPQPSVNDPQTISNSSIGDHHSQQEGPTKRFHHENAIANTPNSVKVGNPLKKPTFSPLVIRNSPYGKLRKPMGAPQRKCVLNTSRLFED